MVAKVYFIGGASAAGKSYAAQVVSRDVSLPVIGLDKYYNMLKKAGVSESVLKGSTKTVCFELVGQLIGVGSQCIVEGGWINPREASQLAARTGFYPVFCGYPNAEPQKRLERIRSNKQDRHWLCGKTCKEALEYLKKQAQASNWYKNECKTYELTFVDFSDFECGLSRLRSHFKDK